MPSEPLSPSSAAVSTGRRSSTRLSRATRVSSGRSARRVRPRLLADDDGGLPAAAAGAVHDLGDADRARARGRGLFAITLPLVIGPWSDTFHSARPAATVFMLVALGPIGFASP